MLFKGEFAALALHNAARTSNERGFVMKAQLNRIALRAADADKAVADLHALLGVTFYGPYDDEHMGLRVALPKTGGIEVMAPMHDHDAIGAYQRLQTEGEGVSGIAVRVDDFEEARAAFAAKGLKPISEFWHGKFHEMIFAPCPETHGLEIAVNEFPDANGAAIQVALDMGADWKDVCDVDAE